MPIQAELRKQHSRVLQLRNGQFRDFASLLVAVEEAQAQHLEIDMSGLIATIRGASIAAGLRNMTVKQERDVLYNPKNGWADAVQVGLVAIAGVAA